jgi:hypothetical protein
MTISTISRRQAAAMTMMLHGDATGRKTTSKIAKSRITSPSWRASSAV